MSKIAILGTGSVGKALGIRLLACGREFHLGARSPQKSAEGLNHPQLAGLVLPLREAVARAEIVFLALPANALLKGATELGDLNGKLLIDCSNPLAWKDGPVWVPPPEGSVAPAVSAIYRAARVVKGFNHFGAEVIANPLLDNGAADAFFASDDAAAKRDVMELAAAMGFAPHDAGPLRNAAVLENLAVLWIHLAMAAGQGRSFSFSMIPLRSA